MESGTRAIVGYVVLNVTPPTYLLDEGKHYPWQDEMAVAIKAAVDSTGPLFRGVSSVDRCLTVTVFVPADGASVDFHAMEMTIRDRVCDAIRAYQHERWVAGGCQPLMG